MSLLETLQSDGHAALGPRAQEIRELGPWFHNLHLDDGSQTAPDHPLGDFPARKWRLIAAGLPSLAGARVLDVGCNAGYHAFEMSRLGASVLATDLDDHYLRQARWAQRHLSGAQDVEFRQASVYDLQDWDARFDLINFQGVLYHLRYPLLALDVLAARCERWMIFQSLSLPPVHGGPPHDPPQDLELDERDRLADPDWPQLAFVEHRLAGDPTNWWVPNEAAVYGMVRAAGFEVVRWLAPETWLCERVRTEVGPRLGFAY